MRPSAASSLAAAGRVLLLAALAAALLAPGCAAQGLMPSEKYIDGSTDSLAVLAPNTALGGMILRNTSAPDLGACSAACFSEPACDAFNYCDKQAGCDFGMGAMEFTDCFLMGEDCQLVYPVVSRNASVVGTSGLPIRQTPMDVPGFATRVAEGVDSADIECVGTVQPGICAYDDPIGAAAVCSYLDTCRSVVVYSNGTDGCSPFPLAVLKRSGLSPASTFVASSVYTLEQVQDEQLTFTYLLQSEGQVIAPTEAETAAAEAAAVESAATSAADVPRNSTAWLGCIVAPQALMSGHRLELVPGVESAEACCRLCRQDTDERGRCNVWNYCDRAAGCSYSDQQTSVTLAAGECELARQTLADPELGWPPAVTTKGAGVTFTGGAPLSVAGPVIPGFQRRLAVSLFGQPGFNCPNTIRPGTQECVLTGTLSDLTAFCAEEPDCAAFVYKPEGSLFSDGDLAYFRKPEGANLTLAIMNPTGVLYVNENPRSAAASLSAGAIAGIAVGAAAGAALAAAAAWLVCRRRRRRAAVADPAPKASLQGSVSTLSAPKLSSVDASAALEEGHGGGANGHASAVAAGASGFSLATPPPGTPAPGEGGGGAPPPVAAVAGAAGPPRLSPFAMMSQSPLTGSEGSAQAISNVSTGSGGGALEQQRARRQVAAAERSAILPELLAARAAQHGSSGGGGGSSGGGMQPAPSAPPLALDSLPAALRDWVVPREAVVYLKRADGEPLSLGEGASGRVYKAVWNGEVVAAKEIDLGASLETQQAFVAEAGRLVLLRHPNVVSFYGCALEWPKGILLMELCEGRDLHSVLALTAAGSAYRLFGWYRRGRRVALEVGRALNYLHSKNVVHMDIKSSNVLLSASGTAKIADVGLSRQQTKTVLSDLSMIGTFAWAAPEVLMGGTNCTRQVDIYSFGVLLWEIITGERPLRGNLRLPRVPDECPQEAVDLMLQCLKQEPDARPTALQLLRRLSDLSDASGTLSPALDRAGSNRPPAAPPS